MIKLGRTNFVGLVFRLSDGSKLTLECQDESIKEAVEDYIDRLLGLPATPDECTSSIECAHEWEPEMSMGRIIGNTCKKCGTFI